MMAYVDVKLTLATHILRLYRLRKKPNFYLTKSLPASLKKWPSFAGALLFVPFPSHGEMKVW